MSSLWKLIITFLSGLLLGGALVGFGLHCYIERKANQTNDPQHLLDRLSGELDLNAEQKERVSTLLKASAPKMDNLRKDMETRSHALWMDFDASLRPLLTQDQNGKLDAMEKRWRDKKGWKVGMSGVGTFKDNAPKPGPK